MAAVESPPADWHPPLQKRRSSLLEPPSMSKSLRMIMFGSSGHHQFSLTESILQSRVFNGADPDSILTTKKSASLFEKNVTLVNTPNLINHDILHYTLKKELKKAVCFSCPGPHAVLYTLNPLDLPENVYDVFKPLVQYFGEHIWNHTVIILYHEEAQWRQSLEDSVKKHKQFKELLEKCGQRYFVFNGKENRNEGNETRRLFDEIVTMVVDHGFFSNLEFKDAEKRIKKEEKIIENQRKLAVSVELEELKKKMQQHSQEDLEREVNHFKEKIQLQNRERAEMQVADRLGFTLRVVDYAAAIGKGAFVGAVFALAMGFPGIAIGSAVGATLGGLLGGAAGAAWNMITNALADFGRDAT